MGYLKQGKTNAYFIRMSEDMEEVFFRLFSIGKRTKSKRIRKKIAKRIDSLVQVNADC